MNSLKVERLLNRHLQVQPKHDLILHQTRTSFSIGIAHHEFREHTFAGPLAFCMFGKLKRMVDGRPTPKSFQTLWSMFARSMDSEVRKRSPEFSIDHKQIYTSLRRR